jgi:hypothetical protein
MARGVFLILSAFSLLVAIWPTGGGAHEPITTQMRFNREIIRVLGRSCLGCHRPGGIAPMSLVTYEEARPWAKAMKEELLEQRMPPWPVLKGFGDFINAPPLTQREIDMVVNWVEGGAPRGDPKDYPSEPLFSDDWPLGKPDLLLKPDAEQEIAPDADHYRIIRLPTGLKEDSFIEAIDLLPGNRSVVHCAVFYAESKSAEPVVLGTWVPGQRPWPIPGAAFLLRAGSILAVKIHYRGAGEPAKDKSAVGLYFSKEPAKPITQVSINCPDRTIPAGISRHRVQADFALPASSEAVAILPNINPLVVSFEAIAYRPDGTAEVLIWARGSRFDWQYTYYFKRPVPLPLGSRVQITAYFDNSEANPANPNSPPRPTECDWLCRLFLITGED